MSTPATVPGGGKVLQLQGVLKCGRCPSYEAPECVDVTVYVFKWVDVNECDRSKDLPAGPCHAKVKC